MVNLFFKRLLGQFPATHKYVKQLDELRFEMARYDEFAQSDKLARFRELTQIVASAEHQTEKIRLQNLAYKGSSEQAEEKEHAVLLKNKNLKTYFAVKEAGEDVRYQQVAESTQCARVKELIASIAHPDSTLSNKERKELLKEQKNELKSLRAMADVKFYEEFGKSKRYNIFKTAEGSPALHRFLELDARVKSTEFQERKAYLLDPKKFEKSEGWQHEQELAALKADPEIVWFQKLEKSNGFAPHRAWKQIFEEQFLQLDEATWGLIPFHGMVSLLGRSYVPEGNLQYHTPGQNVRVANNCLTIETRAEKAKGVMWHPSRGFRDHEFDYTSGSLNTGHSFRLNSGKIEVVASFTHPREVVHAFSLNADNTAPHIDLFCSGAKKGVKMRLFLKNQPKADFQESVSGLNFADEHHYSLEWGANSLVWRINGVQVASYTGPVPQDMMYLSISSVLLAKVDSLPATMSVRSVRVFEQSK